MALKGRAAEITMPWNPIPAPRYPEKSGAVGRVARSSPVLGSSGALSTAALFAPSSQLPAAGCTARNPQICQVPVEKSKVITLHSTPLTPLYPQRVLAG